MNALSVAIVAVAAVIGQGQPPAPPKPGPARTESNEAAESLAKFKEHWKLQLAPEKLPDIREQLNGTEWAWRSPRDILGRGLDRFIAIPQSKDQKVPPEIIVTTVQHRSVNDRAPQTERKKTYALTVAGPFLEYDGVFHSAFLSKDRKMFIPDAVLRIADNTWYFASARKIQRPNGEREIVEITEYLLEFNNDPVRQRDGKLTLHQRVGTSTGPMQDAKTFETIWVNTSFPKARDSEPNEVQINIPNSRSLTIFFYAGKDYAVPAGDGPPSTRIYQLEKSSSP